MNLHLNRRAWEVVESISARRHEIKVAETTTADGTRLFDFGVGARGGLHAGLELARVCMADLASISLNPSSPDAQVDCKVAVSTDQPLLACMGSQYAGWPVQTDSFFAMGSGPMRAVRGKEKVLLDCELLEQSECAVGVLESDKLPTAEDCQAIAAECGVAPDRLAILVAPVTSLAGTIQVVARSVETAMHKMFELGFDLNAVTAGYGCALLPPCASDTLTGIGRTNDAIMYGGMVTLWMQGEDDQLMVQGAKIPSCSSEAYGATFAEIFKQHNGDFYKIDPMLFSPARVRLVNLTTGRQFDFGRLRPDILRESFGVGEVSDETS